MTFSFIFN